MQGRNRILRLDVADYTNKIVCPLYDNSVDVSGQASDVIVTFERNGWKELSFSIPSKAYNSEGIEEDNFRLNYIIADYRLRIISDDGIDWFIISQAGIKHEAFSKKVSITAGHISQRLKNRALDLEFSDDEGNNVGTAEQFLNTILENTDWEPGKVASFYEDDGKTIKIRSLEAPLKTGAFKLIEDMCELFEAKPVYYVDENNVKRVDILPMNPFSDLEEGEIPDAVYPGASQDEKYLVDANVIELHYDKSVKNLERNVNADNISTRLYAYGAFGDTTTGYCSVQTATHEEYYYTLSENYEDETEFEIRDKDNVSRYFKAENIEQNDVLIWSMLDINSRKYIWNNNQETAYEVYTTQTTAEPVLLEGEIKEEQNYFPFLSDYTYYRKVGLLTDEMFQKVAKYQRKMTEYYKAVIEAQNRINVLNEQLSNVGVPSTGFAKLDIESCEQSDKGSVITLRWSENYPDGIIYRSDYYNKERDYFKWHVAENLKANGDPTSGAASIIYVLHDTEPVVTWDRAYLKDIDGRTYEDAEGNIHPAGYDYAISEGERPHVVTVWSNLTISETDSVYLFCGNAFSGKLGTRFSEDEAAVETLSDVTTIVTEKHPVIFVEGEEKPEINFNTYGWLYQYDSTNYDEPGILYFSWSVRGDTEWKDVYIQDYAPSAYNGSYFYNTKMRTLWHGEDNKWVHLESIPEETTLAQQMGSVLMYCRRRDKIYKGLYEKYYYYVDSLMHVGNYAVGSSFGYYWLFTTDMDIEPGSTIKLDTTEGYIYQDDNVEHIVTCRTYPDSTLIYPSENDLNEATFFEGSIYRNEPSRDGTDMATDRAYRSNYISVWPNETYVYSMPENCFVVLYDANRNYLGYVDLDGTSGEFSIRSTETYGQLIDPELYANFKQVKYIRIVVPKSSIDCEPAQIKDLYSVRIKDYNSICFANDKKYVILSPTTTDDDAEPIGINYLIKRFRDLSETLYLSALPSLNEAQKVITDENADQAKILGDILREGWWQENSYVEGDEQRMYNDALDNLKKVAQPEINYTFDYLDLYGSNPESEYCTEEYSNIEWPDTKITDAVHLIDPEMEINQWAYIDKLSKCYDQPWKTTIEINTQLTLMNQHEFKDVMARIAEVASETKAKQTIYKRAEAISEEGTINAENIEGEINTTEVKISGGTSGWSTDSKGNMILESADGLSAIRFNGTGLSMSNSKDKDGDWQWEQLGDGFGINANTIRFGSMKGDRIEVGTISANKLMANVGNELDIGSNKALNLYATIDGQRPTGSLKTTDAAIEIRAGKEDELTPWSRMTYYKFGDGVIYQDLKYTCIEPHTSGDSIEFSKWRVYDGYSPASVNIGSGGAINISASGDSTDPKSDPVINIASGGSINMLAGSGMNISAGGSIDIAAGGKFTISSENFNIDNEGNVTVGGGLNAQDGVLTVGGWYISDSHIGSSEDMNDSAVGLYKPNDDNDVVFWAGDSDKTKAAFRVFANGKLEASNLVLTGRVVEPESVEGDIVNAAISGGTINGARIDNSIIDDTSITAGPVRDNESNITGYRFHLKTDGTAEIRKGSINIGDFALDSTGSVNMLKGNIHLGEIKEGNEVVGYKFNALNDGSVSITKGSINISGANDSCVIENTGKLTATGADITGDIKGSIANKWTINSLTGVLSGENGLYLDPKDTSEYSLWVGTDTPSNAAAYVKQNGDIKAKNITISGDETLTGVLTANSDSYSTIKYLKCPNLDQSSSIEVKENVVPLEHRDAFDKLEPVSFKYIGQPETHFGLIYEKTSTLYPEICHDLGDGSKGISYIDMISVLIKEVQDLRKRVSELERE